MMPSTLRIAFPGLAALGWLASAAVHVGGYFGVRPMTQPLFLVPVLLLVWAPAIAVAVRVGREHPHRQVWSVLLRGCPRWMRRGLVWQLLYGLGNFVVFYLRTADRPAPVGAELALVDVIALSGHCLVFFAAAFAILYSAARVP